MKNKTPFFDNIYIGFVLGAIVPLITFVLYYFAKFSDLLFLDYIASIHHYRLLFKILSLCVLSDLPLFYLFIHFKLMKGARGVVSACFLFAFMVMGYRIFN
ncbi:MAG TPA: hypothetical protein VJY41_05625 [Prolixibacteraceae bacterium]|nr:hypothetical protein [Prolixibacteraceae bacterium]